VIGNILVFLGFHYSSVEEDELDLLKWGGKYRRYMDEVRRVNFLLGMWRLCKRKQGYTSYKNINCGSTESQYTKNAIYEIYCKICIVMTGELLPTNKGAS